MSEYVTVPVLEKFDRLKQIGELKILKSKLPSKPNFVFSLGYVKDFENDTFEIECVGLVLDKEYMGYVEDNSDSIY